MFHDDEAHASSAHRQRASWYAQGRSDGLGDRLLMFDNSDAPSLELLRLRPDFAQVAGFETALREQVQRLRQFRHPAFAQVRSVQRLEPDDDLALISNWTPGKRLSEVLHESRGPAFAATLIGQLAPALVQLQQHDAGISHGVLNPDRIVVSPDGRVTIVEHVIGPAIERLGLGVSQLASLGIALPPSAGTSRARLDVAGDWYQLGLVAVSVLIGRPVTTSELPQLEAVLDRLGHATSPSGPPVPAVLRRWLDRALQISGPRIESGAEGRAALEELLHKQPRDSRRPGSGRSEKIQPAARSTVRSERLAEVENEVVTGTVVVMPNRRPADEVAAFEKTGSSSARPASVRPLPPIPSPPRTSIPRPAPVRPGGQRWTLKVRVPAPTRQRGPKRWMPGDQGVGESRTSPGPRAQPAVAETRGAAPRPRAAGGAKMSTWVVAALGLLAATEAGVIVGLGRAVWSTPSAPVVVETAASGEHMVVSHRSTGAAPLRLAVAPDLGWVRVTTALSARPSGSQGANRVTGRIQITSPIELEVFEKSRLIGSVPGQGLEIAPGQHDIELVNAALGYRLRQILQIEAGQTVSIHVAPPDGWVTVDAPARTEVWVDGRGVGRTPLVKLPVAAGVHDVVFRHPELGGDQQRVTIRSDAMTRVTGNLRR